MSKLGEDITQELKSLIEQTPALSEAELASAASKTIHTKVNKLRQELEASPTPSGAQTFSLMLQIGKMLGELANDKQLPPVFRTQLHNQIGDLVYVVKMDANSAVISGILNAARKQGARLKFKIEPEQ